VRGFSCAIKERLKGVVHGIFDTGGKARLGGVGKSWEGRVTEHDSRAL